MNIIPSVVPGYQSYPAVGRRVLLLGDSQLLGANATVTISAGNLNIVSGEIIVSGITTNVAVGSKFCYIFTNNDAVNHYPQTVTRIISSTSFACATTLPDQALSAMSGNTMTFVGFTALKAQTHVNWLRALIQGGFDIVANHSQGGAVSGPWASEGANIRNMTSIANKIIPLYSGLADYVMLEAGSNDFNANAVAGGKFQATDTYTNLYNIGLFALQYGITPIIYTPIPIQNTATGWLATPAGAPPLQMGTPAFVAALRRLLIDLGRRDSRFKIIDLTAAYEDPLSATANFKTNYNTDALHSSQEGGWQTAKLIKTAASTIFPALDRAPVNILDQSVNSTVPGTDGSLNQVKNALFQGTGGTNSGTGASGTVANNWINFKVAGATSTCVASTSARSDGYGNNQRMVCTAAAAESARFWLNQTGIHSNLTAGSWYKCGLEVTISSVSNLTYISLQAFTTNASGSSTSTTLENSSASPFPTEAGTQTLWLETGAFQCLSSATAGEIRLDMQFGATAGGITVDCGRAFIIPVSAP